MGREVVGKAGDGQIDDEQRGDGQGGDGQESAKSVGIFKVGDFSTLTFRLFPKIAPTADSDFPTFFKISTDCRLYRLFSESLTF